MQFPRPGRLLLWAVIFVFLAPIMLGIPASLWLSWRLDPVQSFYFGPYLASALEGGTKGMLSTVRYAEKTAPGRKPEMLLPEDAVVGKGTQRLALSPKALAEGWQGVTIGPPQKVRPLELEAYLRDTVFEGESAWGMFLQPICYGLAGVIALYTAWSYLRQRNRKSRAHEERHGRRTKGPELMAGLGLGLTRFRRSGEDGIRLRMQGRGLLPGGSYRIPKRLESSHILLLGDTGSGKSSAIRQILRQVQERGESAIVNDPARDFIGSSTTRSAT